MNIVTKVETFVKKEITVVEHAFSSGQVHDIEVVFDKALHFAQPIVATFVATGYAPAAVVAAMIQFAIPVADDMANGKITEQDEIKKVIGAGVSGLITKNFGLSNTLAVIVNNLAYVFAKPSVAVPALVPAA